MPNRKQRNQPSSRVHDIEFATEISTSLLSQVRHLQSLLVEKEDALRSITLEKSRLEAEAEGFNQRLRSLNESEHRYKDENWSLETQIHEHIATAKEAADREKKLTQALNTLQAEKAAAQKELDETKLNHVRLTEDHAATIKHHDAELGSVKRHMTMVENERVALQRKIEDLAGQNKELAMAVAQNRGRTDERDQERGLSDDDFETADDNVTPEHSPPPSPVKGTPRHSMLESETLKSSLHHAHRMIQNLKGNIHREKTEKLELKRMLQDARDELENRRGEGGLNSSTSSRRNRKVDSTEFKKPLKPGQLGKLRSSRSEISLEDPNWEDHQGRDSPSNIETANETDAFETANERGTETEDFHTGAEDISGSDELTETEGAPAQGGTLRAKKPSALNLGKPGNRNSFQSTASLSGDEYGYEDVKTPVQTQPQRLRLRMNRAGYRGSRADSEEPNLSPASFANSSQNGTPQAAGQTLFAELEDLEGGSEDESIDATPSRKSVVSPFETPVSRPGTAKTVTQLSGLSPIATRKPTMVDSGMMTEAWEPQLQNLLSATASEGGAARPISNYSNMSSQYDPDMDEKLAKFPSPPTSPDRANILVDQGVPVSNTSLTISNIQYEHVEPVTGREVGVLAPLSFSSINAVATEPVSPALANGSSDITAQEPATPKAGIMGSVFGWGKNKSSATPIIAEDETCQSPNQSPKAETPESQKPFKEISANATERTARRPHIPMSDESSQTTLTAQQIENMLNEKYKRQQAIVADDAMSPPRGAIIPPALRVRKSQESIGSVGRARAKMADPDFVHDTVSLKRPASAGSNRASTTTPHPPLPNDHKQAIAAAAQRAPSSSGVQGTMGPPLMPASAYRTNPTFRPRTPSISTTPRALRSSEGPEVQAASVVGRSRRSSFSSFASEVDTRFNLRQNMPHGMDPGADPRMIQAITQTMIGEYLWKYTRKTGRGEMSENRHRRYFWVHPYTRTLYWSDRDPSQAGRAELKAKSVAIEAVRVVTDDNPMPPGLHRKSLIILTPGRTVKFTAATGQRHETWFNALSYLLLRTTEDGAVGQAEELASGALTREDVDEFNGYGGRSSRAGAASLSSYNSRTTRNESPGPQSVRVSMQRQAMAQDSRSSRVSTGTFSRLSNYWKPGEKGVAGSATSRRPRQSMGGSESIYQASEVHDSAEDLREIIEKQDRESDRLENVRACCDGT